MIQNNSSILSLSILFLSISYLSASQGDELWSLVEDGSLEDLQEWAGDPFNSTEETDKKGFTLLHMCAQAGKREFLEFLLPLFDVNARSYEKETPLHEAAYAGHSELVPLLAAAGANINALDIEDNTPLHLAIFSKSEPAVAALLKYGANLGKQNQHGETPLHEAVNNNDYKTVKALLEYRPELEIENNAGRTPVELASTQEIADELFDRGAIPPTQDELDEEWRRDDVRDMLSISSKRYYSRLYLTQKLLGQLYNIPTVLQDLITIDMLAPANRVKEIRGMAISHRRKRCRRDIDGETLGAKTLKLQRQ